MPTVIALTQTPTIDRPNLTIDGSEIVIERSGFPVTPIYDQIIDKLGDPDHTPVVSMRARATARVAVEGGTVEDLVWIFGEDTDG